MRRLIAIAVLVLSSSGVSAQTSAEEEGSWYTGIQTGLGHMKIGTERERSLGLHWSLGYRFNSGFLAELGQTYQTSDDVFGNGDTFDLKREDLMLGYRIRLGNVLRLIPKVGRVHWDLHARDGALINTSEDDESVDLGEGSDDIAELVLEFQLSELLQLGIAHEKLRYRFGETDVTEMALRFEF
jgi:hypothetical protein